MSPISGFAACCAAVPTIGVTGVPSGSGSTPSVSACSSLYHAEIVAAPPAPFVLKPRSTSLSLNTADERGVWLVVRVAERARADSDHAQRLTRTRMRRVSRVTRVIGLVRHRTGNREVRRIGRRRVTRRQCNDLVDMSTRAVRGRGVAAERDIAGRVRQNRDRRSRRPRDDHAVVHDRACDRARDHRIARVADLGHHVSSAHSFVAGPELAPDPLVSRVSDDTADRQRRRER